MIAQFTAQPGLINLHNPVAWNHWANGGLYTWFLTIKGQMGALSWRDIASTNKAGFTFISPATSFPRWGATIRPGGIGQVNCANGSFCVIESAKSGPLSIINNTYTYFTISGWIYMASSTNNGAFGWLQNAGSRLGVSLHSGTISFYCDNGLSNSATASVPGAGAFHYIAVFDGTQSGAARQALYVNGVAQSLSGASPPANWVVPATDFARIGVDPANSFNSTAGFDSIRFMPGVALGAGQASALYELEVTGYPGMLNRAYRRGGGLFTGAGITFGAAAIPAAASHKLTPTAPANTTLVAGSADGAVAPDNLLAFTVAPSSSFVASAGALAVAPGLAMTAAIAMASVVGIAAVSPAAIDTAMTPAVPASSSLTAIDATASVAANIMPVIAAAGASTFVAMATGQPAGAESTFSLTTPASSALKAVAGLRKAAAAGEVSAVGAGAGEVTLGASTASAALKTKVTPVRAPSSSFKATVALARVEPAQLLNSIAPTPSAVLVRAVANPMAANGHLGAVSTRSTFAFQAAGLPVASDINPGSAMPIPTFAAAFASAPGVWADVLLIGVSTEPYVIVRRSFLPERTGSRGLQ